MNRKGENNLAVIFDMDGVVVDNTKYHVLSWQNFCRSYGVNISRKFVVTRILGRIGKEIYPLVIKEPLSEKEMKAFSKKREAWYRKMYSKAIKPTKGLLPFLEHLRKNGIKIALATAAPPANVKFVLSRTKTRKYFKVIIDDTGVKRGKPHPDIFLKAARKLKINPKSCIVFEDAMLGIEAAKKAGMKVVGVATSHKASELKHTDMVIKDFTRINLGSLANLWTLKKK
jgi:beta-phosphoglucomutase